MRNVYLSATLLFLSTTCYCQQSEEDKRLLDSLLKNDPALRMFSLMNKPVSYLQLNAGITNKLFSVTNNSLNVMQENKHVIFTPSLEYFNKCGLGISFTSFFINEKNTFGLHQYSITPSYDFQSGSKVAAGISYTHFFIQNKYSQHTTPIQNDFYAYAYLKKPWLKPGIAIGYSTGESHQTAFVDTSIRQGNRIFAIVITDSAKIKLQSFSLIGSVSHTFTGRGIVKTDDAIDFTPQLSLNAGYNKYTVTHKVTTSIPIPDIPLPKGVLKQLIQKNSRIRNFQEEGLPRFEIESIGLNLNLNYNIGKFDFDPQVYLDYYLPTTTENRFTQVFSFNVGYTF